MQRARLYLKLEALSDPAILSAIRGAVEQFAEAAGFAEEDCRAITVAVDEAVTNIIRHAYQNRHDQPMTLVCEADGAGVEFRLTDTGAAADPAKFCSKPLGEISAGGLGTHIMAHVMNRVTYERSGEVNLLRMSKLLAPKHAQGE